MELVRQAGVIRLDDSKQLALAAWSLMYGLAMLIDGQIDSRGSVWWKRALGFGSFCWS
ncbi:hypothetical protein [Chamaesiphon polymorphus]|uniref:hypothetical protein n=1 Tax=Chamaesiphon polymorphus TaxID=2107691 RepID=UPI001C6298EA|nr:hypothetical protein [Chamaesiphon polymorphus]